jgi:hypothetical protein
MKKAILLAKVQQTLLDSKHFISAGIMGNPMQWYPKWTVGNLALLLLLLETCSVKDSYEISEEQMDYVRIVETNLINHMQEVVPKDLNLKPMLWGSMNWTSR